MTGRDTHIPLFNRINEIRLSTTLMYKPPIYFLKMDMQEDN